MATTPGAESLTPTELTQRTGLADIGQQRWLLIGAGLAVFAIFMFWLRRPARQQQAARRLVRDWSDVDDVDDARDLLGSNLPAVLQPALLVTLEAIERQVDRGFRRLERAVQKL
jgi:hypothetical protein